MTTALFSITHDSPPDFCVTWVNQTSLYTFINDRELQRLIKPKKIGFGGNQKLKI